MCQKGLDTKMHKYLVDSFFMIFVVHRYAVRGEKDKEKGERERKWECV